jgi:hypothetical protein
VTLNIPSIAGKSIGSNDDNYTDCKFFFSAGANNNVVAGGIGVQSASFIIWGIQLEVGSVATPLEKIDPQQDIAKCQRFYQTGAYSFWAIATGPGYFVYSHALPVAMRAAPTIIATPTTTTNCTPTVTSYGGSFGVLYQMAAAAAGQCTMAGTYTASADLV